MTLKDKLTSRKFWLAVAGVIGGILIALNVEESTATQVTAIITSAGSIIAYIFGESIVDANYAQAENVFTNEELSDE